MKRIVPLILAVVVSCTCLYAQKAAKSNKPHKQRPPLDVRFGMVGAAGIHQEYDRPDFVCFDCTPREFSTAPRPNAVAVTGLTADFGRLHRHLGLRATMAVGYQQFNWDYEISYWPRHMPRQLGVVHLRANNLIGELNLRLRYSTLGKRPTVFQLGAYADGLLTRRHKSYLTTSNRSAFLQGNFLMPPAGVLVNAAQQFPFRKWVFEPYAEARYSLRYVMWDPNMASASIQLGLNIWLPDSNH